MVLEFIPWRNLLCTKPAFEKHRSEAAEEAYIDRCVSATELSKGMLAFPTRAHHLSNYNLPDSPLDCI